MNLLLRSHENVNDPVWSVIFSIILLLIGVGYCLYTILDYDDGKTMPRSQITKIDILSRVYKMKTSLYDGEQRDKSGEWHDGYHQALSEILNIVDEFSR